MKKRFFFIIVAIVLLIALAAWPKELKEPEVIQVEVNNTGEILGVVKGVSPEDTKIYAWGKISDEGSGSYFVLVWLSVEKFGMTDIKNESGGNYRMFVGFPDSLKVYSLSNFETSEYGTPEEFTFRCAWDSGDQLFTLTRKRGWYGEQKMAQYHCAWGEKDK